MRVLALALVNILLISLARGKIIRDRQIDRQRQIDLQIIRQIGIIINYIHINGEMTDYQRYLDINRYIDILKDTKRQIIDIKKDTKRQIYRYSERY